MGGAPPGMAGTGKQITPELLHAVMQMLQKNPQIVHSIQSGQAGGGAGQNLAAFGSAAQGGSMPPRGMTPAGGGMSGLNPAELARLGRGGDSLMAHLTPGEIAIPPDMQNRKVLATLGQAFHQHGGDIRQFTAGSPQSSHNPQTGLAEYNGGGLMSLLPMALGIAGMMVAPEIVGPAGMGLMSGAMAGAVGSGLGTAAGTALNGGGVGQSLGAGLGAGVGGYLAGGLGGALGSAAGGAAGGGGQGAITPDIAAASGTPGVAEMASHGGSMTPNGGSDPFGSVGSSLKSGLGVGIGGMVGGSLFQDKAKSGSQYPPGFNDPFHDKAGQNGNALLGNLNSSIPHFGGYDPLKAATQGGYNFYAPQ